MPRQDAKFAESPGACGGDVRQGVSLGKQVPRIAVDLGEHDQSDSEISGSVENYGKQGQHRCRNAEESAADAGTENFISWTAPKAGGEGESRGQQPCQQKANASDTHGDGPALTQETLYRLAESMRGAEIAVNRVAEVAGIKAENVVFTSARLAQAAHTFAVPAALEFPLVAIQTASHAHQRGRKHPAKKHDHADRSKFLCEGPYDCPARSSQP